MHAENLFVDEGGDRQAVEDVREDLPESDGVPPLAFVVKPINSIDLRALVIASQEEEVLGILHLVAEKEANAFDRLFSTVDVISEEEVVGLWWEAAILEDPEEIVVLPVHITYKLNESILNAV